MSFRRSRSGGRQIADFARLRAAVDKFGRVGYKAGQPNALTYGVLMHSSLAVTPSPHSPRSDGGEVLEGKPALQRHTILPACRSREGELPSGHPRSVVGSVYYSTSLWGQWRFMEQAIHSSS